jgi:hypothetical protein
MRIEELPAGREMDALIAEKVMGWKPVPINYWLPEGKGRGDKPVLWLFNHPKYGEQTRAMHNFRPSSDIAAAWEVVEEIKSHVLRVDITISADTRLKPYAVLITGKGIREWWQREGDTLPLAICRAALPALGVTEI